MLSTTIKTQFRSNIVALCSLSIAITALFYNTWRNEHTEKNRNIRPAAFEVLKQLGELQILVNSTHYQKGTKEMMNPIEGWGHVSFASDLSQLLPQPVPKQIDNLVHVWRDNWETIDKEESADKISHEIDESRTCVLTQLKSLR